MSPRERIESLMKSVDALSLRERIFVLAAMLMVLGAIWQAAFNGPLTARSEAAQQSIAATTQRMRQLDEAIEIAASGLDGGISGRAEVLQSLREAVAAREEEVRVFTSDLVDPAQMRLVVENLIKRQSSLELVRTHNVPAAPLLDPNDEDAQLEGEEPNLYLHGLVIELEGSYLDVVDYLEAIEQLPWRIFFSRIDLESLEHPKLRITLELNTLSLEEDWLGV